MRRLIVACDGTWQAAQFQSDPRKLTNIARLFTAINRQDQRQTPPIEQVKLYIAGPGTGQELVAGVISVSAYSSRPVLSLGRTADSKGCTGSSRGRSDRESERSILLAGTELRAR